MLQQNKNESWDWNEVICVLVLQTWVMFDFISLLQGLFFGVSGVVVKPVEGTPQIHLYNRNVIPVCPWSITRGNICPELNSFTTKLTCQFAKWFHTLDAFSSSSVVNPVPYHGMSIILLLLVSLNYGCAFVRWIQTVYCIIYCDCEMDGFFISAQSAYLAFS